MAGAGLALACTARRAGGAAALDTDFRCRGFPSQVRGRAYPSPALIPRAIRRHCEVSEARVLGQAVYTLTSRRGASAWHVIYTHGGAYVNTLQKAPWDIIGALIASTGAMMTVPVYPLPPEHPYTEGHSLLEHLYRDLLQRVAPERIVPLIDGSACYRVPARNLSA
jgi:acetyl esterase/lipase